MQQFFPLKKKLQRNEKNCFPKKQKEAPQKKKKNMIEKETQTKRHNQKTGKRKIIIDATGNKLYV